MDQFGWLLWLVLGVGLIIAEIYTLGFVLFWVGLGALAAAVAGYFGLGFGGQFFIFAAVSIVLTAMSRTIFAKYLPHGEANLMRSGADSLPGQVGTVTAASKGAVSEGAVKVFGSTWTAYPIEGENELIEVEKVEVVEVKGSSIYVRKFTKQLPDWRQESKNS